jgi:hypothetical protein
MQSCSKKMELELRFRLSGTSSHSEGRYLIALSIMHNEGVLHPMYITRCPHWTKTYELLAKQFWALQNSEEA